MKKFLFIACMVMASMSLGAMNNTPLEDEVMKELVADSPHDFSQVMKNFKPDLGFYMGLDDAPVELVGAPAKPIALPQGPVSAGEKPPYQFEPIIGNAHHMGDDADGIGDRLAKILFFSAWKSCEQKHERRTAAFDRCVYDFLDLEKLSEKE